MYSELNHCRICGNTNLVEVLDLGNQTLTGVFPPDRDVSLTKGPLCLVKCVGDTACGLVQLAHSYKLNELYGSNYGYRSGLNRHMVNHLKGRVEKITERVELGPGDIVVDIGSNDATTLKAYPGSELVLVGIDPTGSKFRQFYPQQAVLIPDFFTASAYRSHFPKQKPKVVTSFAMFYDLESPVEFVREIYEILHPDGVWVMEQSYLGSMLDTNSYDTVCHEHLEYYAFSQIKLMADLVGFRVIDVEFNDVNGGSFAVTMCKSDAKYPDVEEDILEILSGEKEKGYDSIDVYKAFATRAEKNREALLEFFSRQIIAGKRVCGLGASTKGNVILQYCGLTANEIEFIGEVNPDKFGCFTPGTYIPIKPEEELFETRPDYVMVLPWHFRSFFVKNRRFREFNLLFPLPRVDVVPQDE